jgi:hypothetical protein
LNDTPANAQRTRSGSSTRAGFFSRARDLLTRLPAPPRSPRWLPPLLVTLACLGATIYLASYLDRLSPLRTWLSSTLLLLWFWTLVLVAGSLAFGSLICRLIIRREDDLPPLERLLLALAAGIVAFGLCLYVAGAVRLLRPVTAVLLPVAAIVAAMRSGSTYHIGPMLRAAREGWRTTPREMLVSGFGAVCLVFIYLHVLTPEALNHDAHWTHLVNAQDYAREGRLVPLYAGWTRNYPHFASVIYTWCFLVPGLDDSARLLLVMHTELIFFLGTLLAVVPVARWLAHGNPDSGRTAWVAFFLFPSIFVYDSNLGGSADHVAAFFALPLFLAVIRATERFSLRLCGLAGALAGAALITKYQSMYLTAALAVVVAVRIGRAVVRRLRRETAAGPALRQALLGSAVMAATGLVVASPYFIENLVFYRNPVFPFMQNVFTGSRPTFPDAAYLVSNVATPSYLRGAGNSLRERFIEALKLLRTFSFEPHYGFTNGQPYFGFLFTLLSPLALVLPNRRRVLMGALVGSGAIVAWSMTYLVDRNLQIIMPVLVAVMAALIMRIWRLGWTARAAVTALVLLQVAWGADYMLGPVQGTLAHVREGVAGRVNVRETLDRRAMTRALPPNAIVLLHSGHVSLGLDRPVLADLSESQGLFDYHQLRTVREAYDRFKAAGVTHLTWMENNTMAPVKQAEIIFFSLAKPLPATQFGIYSLVKLPALPPPARGPMLVLTAGLAGYVDGMYSIQELSLCEMRPPEACRPPRSLAPLPGPVTPEALKEPTDAVLLGPGYGLSPAAQAVLNERFILGKTTGQYSLYVRR